MQWSLLRQPPPHTNRKEPLHEKRSPDSATRQDERRECVGSTSGLPAGEIETKVALIQALIPLGPHAVGEAFEAEVVALAGHATVGRAGKQAWSAGGGNEARSTWPNHVRTAPPPAGGRCGLVQERSWWA